MIDPKQIAEELRADCDGVVLPYDKWLPIETAPKDGTPILAFMPEENPEFSFMYVMVYDAVTSDWREAAGECYSQYVPTHWMPLPAPPNKA